MNGRSPWRRASILIIGFAAVLRFASSARGSFTAPATVSQTISSATLEPASALAAVTGCSGLLDLSAKADLSWVATPSTFAEGYTVERWRGPTLETTAVVTPRTSTTRTETGLATGTSYTWKISASARAWTSTAVTVLGTTPALCL